jgi:ring-1,2-phenylacetyl-CoA epoxidase subunit PaaE
MNLQLRITKIISETNDTKSFFLQPLSQNFISYKAGQFLTFIFQHRETEIRRSFSLGSVLRVDEEMFITVKRKPNGEISRLLFDHYKEGDILNAIFPSGKFILDENIFTIYYFISAGSGIVPVFALMKELLFFHSYAKIILINQSRSEDDIIYENELQQLKKQFSARFEWIQFFSRPKIQQHISTRLHNDLLEEIISSQTKNEKLRNVAFYLCGPLNYMRMAQFTLKLNGVKDEQIHKEQFVIESIAAPPLIKDFSPKNIILHFNRQTFYFTSAYPQTILDAALKQNIALPYSCKAGQCSTCVAFCKSGKIKMSVNEVLTEKDLNKNLVLTCVGYAETDAELDFDKAINL